MSTSGQDLTTRYGLEEVLSWTDVARTFRGCHPETGNPVAVKLLSATGAAANGLLKQRFESAINVLRSLAHPALPTVIDAGLTPTGDAFIVTDWIEGELLSADAKLPAADLLPAMLQLAEALESLALHGLVHLNLSPENIILADGQPRLLGWGASLLHIDRQASPGMAELAAMNSFAAPELLEPRRAGEALWRADLYSLALMTVKLLGAELNEAGPNVRFDRTLSEELQKPESLRVLLERCLHREPEKRPDSYSELTRALQHSVPRSARRSVSDTQPVDLRDTDEVDVQQPPSEDTTEIAVASVAAAAASAAGAAEDAEEFDHAAETVIGQPMPSFVSHGEAHAEAADAKQAGPVESSPTATSSTPAKDGSQTASVPEGTVVLPPTDEQPTGSTVVLPPDEQPTGSTVVLPPPAEQPTGSTVVLPADDSPAGSTVILPKPEPPAVESGPESPRATQPVADVAPAPPPPPSPPPSAPAPSEPTSTAATDAQATVPVAEESKETQPVADHIAATDSARATQPVSSSPPAAPEAKTAASSVTGSTVVLPGADQPAPGETVVLPPEPAGPVDTRPAPTVEPPPAPAVPAPEKKPPAHKPPAPGGKASPTAAAPKAKPKSRSRAQTPSKAASKAQPAASAAKPAKTGATPSSTAGQSAATASGPSPLSNLLDAVKEHRLKLLAAAGAAAVIFLVIVVVAVVLIMRRSADPAAAEETPPSRVAVTQPDVDPEPDEGIAADVFEPPPEEVVAALELITEGRLLEARSKLEELSDREDEGLLSAQEWEAFRAVEESLIAERAIALRGQLQSAINSDLDRLRQALRSMTRDEEVRLRAIGGGALVDRARSSMRSHDNFRTILDEGDLTEALSAAVAFEQAHPGLAESLRPTNEAASLLEARIDGFIASGRLEDAEAVLDRLQQTIPGREGLSRRRRQIDDLRADEARYSGLLESAQATMASGRPHEGIEILSGVSSVPAEYRQSFADALQALAAELRRLDAEAPTLSLASGERGIEYRKGRPIVIDIEARDDYEVIGLSFRIKKAADASFEELPANRVDGIYRVEVDPSFHDDRPLEFWVSARDRSGNETALGSESEPMELRRRRFRFLRGNG